MVWYNKTDFLVEMMVTQRNSSFVGAAPAQGTAEEMFINAVF